MANGSSPLKVLVPELEVRTVEQNTPFAGVVNTITVSIKANCDLPAGSTVTIHELTGSATPNGTLEVVRGNGGFVDSGVWDAYGNLTLTSVGMVRRQTYEARFNVTNPATSQGSPGVRMRASVRSVYGDISPLVSVLADRNQAELLGVANGSSPLLVFRPSFELSSIEQSTPLANVVNTITVSIKANCDMLPGSNITIFGLTGSQSVDTSSLHLHLLPVQSANVSFRVHGVWQLLPGNLTLTSIGTKRRDIHTILFNLTNDNIDQPSPSVSIHATLVSVFGDFVRIFERPMSKPSSLGSSFSHAHSSFTHIHASYTQDSSQSHEHSQLSHMHNTHGDLLGVYLGRDPLTLIRPLLVIKNISQSHPLPQSTNRISLQIASNCDLAMGSIITVTGLTSSLTPDNPAKRIFGHYTKWFQADRTTWNQSLGTLRLTVSNSSLQHYTQSVLHFYVRNPSFSRPSPIVNASVTVTSLHMPAAPEHAPAWIQNEATCNTSFATPKDTEACYARPHVPDIRGTLAGPRLSPGPISAMVSPGPRGTSLSTGYDPLLINAPIFWQRVISQHNPLRRASNLITVTLVPNFHVTNASNITISGLTGSLTADTDCLKITMLQENCNDTLCTPERDIHRETQGATDSMGDLPPDECNVDNSTLRANNTSPLSCSGAQSRPALQPLHSCGKWTQNGSLILLAQHNGLLPYTRYTIQFVLQNPDCDSNTKIGFVSAGLSKGRTSVCRSAITARVSATIETWLPVSGESAPRYPGVVNVSDIVSRDEHRFGVQHASLPLFVIVPRAEISRIRQARFWPNLPNLINVTFKSNCNVTTGSNITISGLTRTQTTAPMINITTASTNYQYPLEHRYMLASSSLSTKQFRCAAALMQSGHESDVNVFGREVEWNQSTGTIILRVGTAGVDVNRVYEISFLVTQPTDNQDFPRKITMAAVIESGEHDSEMMPISNMQQPLPSHRHMLIDNGTMPLFTRLPGVADLTMVHHSPFPGLVNQVHVRLRFDMMLLDETHLTITGLRGIVAPKKITCEWGNDVSRTWQKTVVPRFKSFCRYNRTTGDLVISTASKNASWNMQNSIFIDSNGASTADTPLPLGWCDSAAHMAARFQLHLSQHCTGRATILFRRCGRVARIRTVGC